MDYAALLGAEPGEAVRPTTVEEITAVIARVDAEGKSVIPWGGGTAQDYGYLPRRCDILLDMSRLSRILAHEPGDMTVTVEAGATLAQVQQTLAQHGQFLPLDPPDADRATIGGILATNAFGPSRPGYGTARDWLIGLKVVDAQGRVVKGGGKVVKNVTGYDLPKLHVGALGTLGVIVEATFKVAPLPESSVVLCFRRPRGTPDASLPTRLHKALSPALSALVDTASADGEPERGQLLFIGFDGAREVVESAAAEADRIAVECGFRPASRMRPNFRRCLADYPAVADAAVRLRVSGCAATAGAQHAALVDLCGPGSVRTLPGTGHTDILLNPAAAPFEATRARILEWAKEHETPIALLKAPASLRRDSDVWWPLPPGFALMRRMKETLDPNGTLNPGRFVGGI